jgi:hypothetical protein
MNPIIEWHKNQIKWWQKKFGWSDCGLLWLLVLKELAFG